MTTQPELHATWGARVRAARSAQGISVKDLADRAEIDRGHLSRFERGLKGASDDLRIRLARELGYRVGDLFPYPDTTR